MSNKKSIVINLFGAPGVGKSTLAYLLTGHLKADGINAELVTEFAKDLTWANRDFDLSAQPYIFGEQYYRIQKLVGKVDFIITDSPLLLSLIYTNNSYPESFKKSVLDIFNSFDNINVLVNRTKPYSTSGRTQTEVESAIIQEQVKKLLKDTNQEVIQALGTNAHAQVDNLLYTLDIKD